MYLFHDYQQSESHRQTMALSFCRPVQNRACRLGPIAFVPQNASEGQVADRDTPQDQPRSLFLKKDLVGLINLLHFADE